jgi:DNA-binding transcriptional ArsR family regulator
MVAQTIDVDEVFAALAEPVRRRMLDVITTRGEATATTVAAEMPITRQAVTKHLAVLEGAGLVASHRQGREVLYAVRPEPLTQAARWMEQLAAEWDTRLQAIKRLAEAAE